MRDLPPQVPRPAPPQVVPAPPVDGTVSPVVTELDPGHHAVTFLWRGEAGEVRVKANKLTHQTETALMERDGDLWHRTFRVPAGFRSSYLLTVDGRDVPDPLNPHRWQGMSIAETSPPSPWLAPREPRDSLSRLPLGWRYDPVRPAEGGLVVLDGENWVDDLPIMLDNLVEAGAIPPVTAWLVESGKDRTARLTCNPDFVDGLPHDGPTVIAGQSFGGLTAVYAAHRHPDRFVAAVSQSGSFWWPGGAEWLTGQVRSPRVHLQVGTLEWALDGPTRRMRDALGDAATFGGFVGGHDRYCWRNELSAGLIAVYDRHSR